MDSFLPFFLHHWLLWLAFFMTLGLLLGTELQRAAKNIQSISPQQLTDFVNHEQGLLLDIRESKEYEKGHVMGSESCPLPRLASQKSKWESWKQKPTVLICENGYKASGEASKWLKQEGFEKVYILKGGILAWKEAHLPLISFQKPNKLPKKKKV